MCSACQVLGDVYTEVLEATHPLHRGPTDHKRSVGPVLSLPEVYNQLSTSSKYAASSLLLMRPRTTVSSANLTVEVELLEDTQSCV